ncbi:alpha-mannosidase [Scheffersomyces coipomensis]|uniref:alpha-mannosidase n=1 Tax=Scheffersomyces coipomensis TaxID=1788519 RepID=UPI00315E00BE
MLHGKIGSNIYHLVLVLSFKVIVVLCTDFNSSFSPDHIQYLQLETKKLFEHAWDSYIEYGFPADEVRPITCEPYGPDYNNVEDTVRNDALGNVSSTVLDNLDSLVIFEEWDQLEAMLEYLKHKQDLFEQDTIVQIFELSIRSLGGLLSAHLLLTDITNKKYAPEKFTKLKEISDKYDGFLLELAYDLGLRLIPAYKTSSRVPVPRINLAKGVLHVPAHLQRDACTSGATTPVLEFTLLSRLTGDPQFEHFSQMTFWKLWSSKSKLNFLPMTIDPIENQWKDAITGIGASIDSFYEYAAKASIIFNDDYMWSVFKTSYKALLTHSAHGGGPNEGSMIFRNVGIHDGVIYGDWIDSLGAFWTGVQVLTGQLKDAVKTHMVYLKIWDYFESIPERWIFAHYTKQDKPAEDFSNIIALEWYPLRPEFIESTYYLYRATKDPMYLQIGERILNVFKTRFKAKCGFSGLQDVRTGQRQNRMETFVMGETLKYLYLLFDVNDDIFLHNNYLMGSKNWVFSTEAHPLWLSKHIHPTHKVKFSDDDSKEVISLRQPMFQQFLSIIHSYDSRRENLFQSEEKLYYRNITLPTVRHFKVPNLKSMYKKDPFKDRFNTCEISPFKSNGNPFLKSGYYEWNRLFNADFAFQDSLVRPDYLSKSHLDGSYIELTKSFYDKYTMFSKGNNTFFLQCPVMSNTEKYELFMGDIKGINEIEVSRLYYKKQQAANITNEISPVIDGDFWIPEINALRVIIEKLADGKIDSYNQLITHEYIRSIRIDDYDNESTCDSKGNEQANVGHSGRDINIALRLVKINGVHVPAGSIVWTMPFERHIPEPGKDSLIDITSDNRVILQGNVIENLMVWYG